MFLIILLNAFLDEIDVVIATQNTSGSLNYPLTYQIKFPPPLPRYYIFKNYPTQAPAASPHLYSFEE